MKKIGLAIIRHFLSGLGTIPLGLIFALGVNPLLMSAISAEGFSSNLDSDIAFGGGCVFIFLWILLLIPVAQGIEWYLNKKEIERVAPRLLIGGLLSGLFLGIAVPLFYLTVRLFEPAAWGTGTDAIREIVGMLEIDLLFCEAGVTYSGLFQLMHKLFAPKQKVVA